jgi:hypothetical protein
MGHRASVLENDALAPDLSGSTLSEYLNSPRSKLQRNWVLGDRLSAVTFWLAKVPAPLETMAGGIRLRLWSEQNIERLREVPPKIANGRKTRYQKQRKTKATKKSIR